MGWTDDHRALLDSMIAEFEKEPNPQVRSMMDGIVTEVRGIYDNNGVDVADEDSAMAVLLTLEYLAATLMQYSAKTGIPAVTLQQFMRMVTALVLALGYAARATETNEETNEEFRRIVEGDE